MVFYSFKRVALVFLIGIITLPVLAETFRLQDIQIEGLERIEAGTVFTFLPIKVGDQLDESQTANIIRTLYKTGFFKDIQLRREGNVLVVVVKERPAIASLSFDGNKIFGDEQLDEALENIGVGRGRVFNRSSLERLENELLQQYFAAGKYGVNVDISVTELPRNRVDVAIKIAEGEAAKIKQVKIVGNESFEEEELTDDLESGLLPWYNFWGSRDQYSKQKLQGDLEIIRSHYLDQGYLKFDISSTQVSISPNKEDIFITINIKEGEQYTLENIELAGKFAVPKEELEALIDITPGQNYSRAAVVNITQAITRRLGDEGYAFPKINPVPEIDEENKQVFVTMFIDPGNRVYVRRVNFRGHVTTRDEVYRRELRQMEGGWYSQTNIELSRRRIQRLPYVQSVEFDTKRVPNSEDFVDIEINVKERLAGSFNIGAGFSSNQGLVLTSSVNQQNFLGTGKNIGFQINTSSVNTIYSFNYVNPYFTIDGVSRGFGLSFLQTDAEEADISEFDSDQYSISTSMGIPLTENDRLGGVLQLRTTNIGTGSGTSQEILEFVEDNGDDYINLSLSANFIHDTRNRSLFASKGNRQNASLEFTIPGSDLEFFKVNYENRTFIPIGKRLTLSLGGEIGYGAEYGDTTDLPFFEKFRAGGFDSVRGYESNSLGPRDSFDDPFGGNFLTTARAEILFPPPNLLFITKDNARLSIFLDVGNVFEDVDDFDSSEVRGAVGLGINWVTGLGGISAALASTFNDEAEDDTETFQFNLGTSF